MSGRVVSLLAVLFAWSSAPREAAACCTEPDPIEPSPCAELELWTSVSPVFATGYPVDGMLLVEFRSNFDGTPAPDAVDFVVSRDGQPVPGVLEDIGAGHILGWRPLAPFAPDAIHQVTGSIANAPIPLGIEDCGDPVLEFAFQFETWNAAMSPLATSELSFSDVLLQKIDFSLDKLVCCDGAFPYEFSCSDIIYDDGACLLRAWTGWVEVSVFGTFPEPWQGSTMVAAQLIVDGQPEAPRFDSEFFKHSWRELHPFCVELVLRNVVTGEMMTTGPQCFGQDVADQLGDQVLDPSSPEIAERCDGPTYTCEIDACGESWLPDACTPWPGDSGTTGAPTTGAPTDPDPNTGTSSSTGGGTDTAPGEDGLVEHGCACGMHEPPLAWLLLVVGSCLARRRNSTPRRSCPAA